MRIMTKGGVWKNTEVRKLVFFTLRFSSSTAAVLDGLSLTFFNLDHLFFFSKNILRMRSSRPP